MRRVAPFRVGACGLRLRALVHEGRRRLGGRTERLLSGKPAPPVSAARIAIADPAADDLPLRHEIEAAAMRALRSGRFILGPEVEAFEGDLARFLGSRFVVACGNGTDAIALMLSAAGAGPDDEVLVPANACVPVAAGVRLAGARPRFCDVDSATLTMDAGSAERALGPRTRFLLPVHLYGGVADLRGLDDLARSRGLTLLEDCAQSHGASLDGRRTGTFGRAAAFSFYPTKNLGAYGDGGAVATDDDGLAERLRRIRQYGWTSRDYSETEGRNSRLDEVQAAILRAKLPGLEAANARRRDIARRYDRAFEGLPLTMLTVLAARPGSVPSAHLYPIRAPRRDALRAGLAERGIETAIHYPVPLHLQPAYAFLGGKPGDFPVSEAACGTVLSLPMRPSLFDAEVETVAAAVREILRAGEAAAS